MQDTFEKPKRISLFRLERIALARSDLLVAALLVFTMLLAGYFRFTGLNWDDYVRFHPDERFLTNTASKLGERNLTFTPFETDAQQRSECVARNPETEGVGGYFDTRCSDLNPHNIGEGLYVYGTMPLFIGRWTGEFFNQLSGTTQWTDYNGVHLVWRAISATCDMLTVLAVFFLGVRLHGKWVGLLAAFLYACAVLPIQISHFATADAMTTLWVAVTLLFVARIQTGGTWLDYALSGAAFGAALASRFNVIPLVGTIIFVSIVGMLPFLDRSLPWSERNRALITHFSGLVLAGFTTFLIFRIFNPYAFMGPGFFGIVPNSRWLEDLGRARSLTSVEYDGPPAWQWVGRPSYLFAWWNMVMWGMGLALGITGWLAWVWSGWQFLRGRISGLKNAPLFLWILVYFGWVGGNHVMSMRYYLPLYPAFALLAAWMLVELVKRASSMPESRTTFSLRRVFSIGAMVGVIGFTLLWAAMFTNIYRHMSTFTQASHWVLENVPGDFAMRLDGTKPTDVPLINISYGNPGGIENDSLSKATLISVGQKLTHTFTAPADGTVSRIHAPRIGSPSEPAQTTALRITITPQDSDQILAETVLTAQFPYRGQQIGDPYDIELNPPLQVEAGKRYNFAVEVTVGSPIVTGGTIFARDGGWEEVVPARICELPAGITLADDPPPGLVAINECRSRGILDSLAIGYDFNLHGEDDVFKRDETLKILDNTDYIIIATNRRYDSQSRIPLRWPMTNRYYDALFSGELGFERVALFHESFELGPLSVSDQHLPIYNSPDWLNELEAEEAFHVYDHPAVFIYRKTEHYSPEKAREILYSVPLNRPAAYGDPYNDPTLIGPVPWNVERADQAPTQLLLTEDMQDIQYSGGTWSERFDRNSAVNTNQLLAVVIWYGALMVFGFAAFPLLFVVTPGLADRGYAIAKFAGVLIVAWSGWILASARVSVWSPEGLRLLLVVLLLVGLIVGGINRSRLLLFIREHWRLLLAIEVLTLGLYLAFIGVRMSNPDLWTSGFGGEKPMDVAYLNGILRSTIFPPIDPWFATGYINYYYFGFVIVAAPTLVTGIMPSLAYNLIVPMLFAMTGMGAFSIAFSLVAAWTGHRPIRGQIVQQTVRRRFGNPYVAGVVALLMAVVLGNLDTPRTFFIGVARAGGYTEIGTMEDYLLNQYRQEYGTEPDAEALADIYERTSSPGTGDYIRYELAAAGNILSSIGRGISNIVSGQAQLYISPDRWFWGPSRVITESVGGGAITEMPIFTFVYGDLHGHMIAMPLMLFIVAMVLNELMMAGREQRGFLSRALGLFLISLGVGLTIATNSWDYPTFLLFGALGLGYAWWLNWRRLSRASLVSMVIRLSAFFILSHLVSAPYRTWFAATYSSVRIWDGNQTPLWGYLTIHGLFLFFILSLLIWETGRWLRATRVRALRGRQLVLIAFLIGIGGILVAALVAALADYQAAIIVIPLVVWIAILFFRPGQSISMQFVLVLAGLALAITLGTEVITLEGDIGRQNTVFKFYMQVWLLFSVVGGAAFAWLLRSSDGWRNWQRLLWYVPAAVLLFVAALFPIMAIRGKAVYRLPPQAQLDALGLTLDGDEFMKYTPEYNEGYPIPMDLNVDYQIINWLQDNVQGSPVIIEGISEGVLYKWGGRISIHTGLPSVIGWDWHQKQQRTFDPLPQLVAQRIANANNFYITPDVEAAWRILRNYDVSYVVVGALENSRYLTSGGLTKLDEMVRRGWLEVVYEVQSRPYGDSIPRPSGKIYKVNKDAAPGIFVAGAPTTVEGN
jgi:YYY domain-containing protein